MIWCDVLRVSGSSPLKIFVFLWSQICHHVLIRAPAFPLASILHNVHHPFSYGAISLVILNTLGSSDKAPRFFEEHTLPKQMDSVFKSPLHRGQIQSHSQCRISMFLAVRTLWWRMSQPRKFCFRRAFAFEFTKKTLSCWDHMNWNR